MLFQPMIEQTLPTKPGQASDGRKKWKRRKAPPFRQKNLQALLAIFTIFLLFQNVTSNVCREREPLEAVLQDWRGCAKSYCFKLNEPSKSPDKSFFSFKKKINYTSNQIIAKKDFTAMFADFPKETILGEHDALKMSYGVSFPKFQNLILRKEGPPTSFYKETTIPWEKQFSNSEVSDSLVWFQYQDYVIEYSPGTSLPQVVYQGTLMIRAALETAHAQVDLSLKESPSGEMSPDSQTERDIKGYFDYSGFLKSNISYNSIFFAPTVTEGAIPNAGQFSLTFDILFPAPPFISRLLFKKKLNVFIGYVSRLESQKDGFLVGQLIENDTQIVGYSFWAHNATMKFIAQREINQPDGTITFAYLMTTPQNRIIRHVLIDGFADTLQPPLHENSNRQMYKIDSSADKIMTNEFKAHMMVENLAGFTLAAKIFSVSSVNLDFSKKTVTLYGSSGANIERPVLLLIDSKGDVQYRDDDGSPVDQAKPPTSQGQVLSTQDGKLQIVINKGAALDFVLYFEMNPLDLAFPVYDNDSKFHFQSENRFFVGILPNPHGLPTKQYILFGLYNMYFTEIKGFFIYGSSLKSSTQQNGYFHATIYNYLANNHVTFLLTREDDISKYFVVDDPRASLMGKTQLAAGNPRPGKKYQTPAQAQFSGEEKALLDLMVNP